MKRANLSQRVPSFVWLCLFVLSSLQPFGNSQSASAAEVLPHSAQAIAHPAPVVGGSGSLDLSSHALNFSASQLGTFSSLTIDVGGKALHIGASSMLTAAEFVAAAQILSGGKQTVALNAYGAASGGTVALNQTFVTGDMGGSLSSILVPKHVNLVDALSALSLTGNLVNYGAIVGSSAKSDLSISATNTYNGVGGSITSGHDLMLADTTSLVNLGTLVAQSTLNINAPSVINSGTLVAATGNVNFGGQGQISLDNTGGIIRAGQNINFRDASYAGTGGINILGGTLASQTLNLFSGCGEVDVTGSNISGVVNTYANIYHIIADSPNLQIGVTQASGDPLIANVGNVVINGAQIGPTSGANLSIVAGKNILSAGGALNTSFTGFPGGQLNLFAGVSFVNQGTNVVQLTGPSVTGGMIDLTGKSGGSAPITAITTGGGNLTMVAAAGSAAGSGTVTLPSNLTIDTSNTGLQGGNVSIIAGAAKGNAISVGPIILNSSAGNSANVFMVSAQPAFNNFQVSGSTGIVGLPQAGGIKNGNISTGTITGSSANIDITADGSITTGTINVSGLGGSIGNLPGQNGGTLFLSSPKITTGSLLAYGGGGAGGPSDTAGGAGGTGGQIALQPTPNNTANSITVNGSINVSGGGGGGGGGGDSTGSGAGSGGAGGGAGGLSITANGPVTVSQGILAADGGDGGAGFNTGVNHFAGSGGGGGGSLGGGGGGGASGQIVTGGDTPGAAGGGGGGLLGGGGGGVTTTTTTGFFGGGGGGISGPGAGGTGDISGGNGDALGNGGSGAGNGTISGGAGGVPFQGGSGAAGAGAGLFAMSGGQIQNAVGSANIVLASPNGTAVYGSAKSPLTLTTYSPSISGSTAFLNMPVSTSVTSHLTALSLSVGAGATVSENNIAVSPVTVSSVSIGQNAHLDLQFNGPSVTVSGPINGAANASLVLFAFPSAPFGGNLNIKGAITMQAPTSLLTPNLVIGTPGGTVTIGGKITSAGGIVILGGTELSINAPITSTSQSFVPAIDISLPGQIVQGASGTITGPSVSLLAAQSYLNPVTVNTPSLSINTAGATFLNATVKDTSIAATTVELDGTFNSFKLTSAGSGLTITNASISRFNTAAISDTSSFGSITFSPAKPFTVNNNLTVNTAGDINGSGLDLEGSVVLTSKTGNIGTPAQPGITSAVPFSFNSTSNTPSVTVTTGGNGQALMFAAGGMLINGITAPGGVSAQAFGANEISLTGNISAKNANALVSLSAFGITTFNQNALITSGQNIALSAFFVGFPGMPLNISAAGSLALNGSAVVLNAVNGKVYLASGSAVSGTLTLMNNVSSLNLSGSLSSPPLAVNLSAKTNITQLNGNILTGSGASFETITAGGSLSLPVGTASLTVAPTGSGNGGTLSIQVASLALPPSFTISANALAGTNSQGGSVTLAVTGKQNLVLSSSALAVDALGAWSGSGTGGAGGLVSVSTGGNITAHQSGIVNQPASGGNGGGGQTVLSAGGNLTLPDGNATSPSLSTVGDSGAPGGFMSLSAGKNLSAAGQLVAANNSGTLLVSANGPNFQIGSSSTPVNGVVGTLSAGNATATILVSNTKGITLNNTLTSQTFEFDTTSFTNGSTGNINYSFAGFPTLTFNSGKGPLSINSASGATWNSSTTLTLNLISGGAMNTGALFTASTILSGGLAVNIQSGGALTLGTNLINAAPGIFGAPQITITAPSFKAPGNGALTLQTSALPGGTISFTLTGKKALTLGTGAGEVQLITGGAGSQSVLVSNGGALTVGTNGITNTGGTISNLTLITGGALSYPNFSSVPVSASANLSFSTNSSTPFTISATAPANGLQMSGTLGAQAISITNSGGSIGTTTPVNVNAFGLSLVAGKSGSVNVADSGIFVLLNNGSAGTSFTLSVPTSGSIFQPTTPITAKTLSIAADTFGATVITDATTVSLSSTTGKQIAAVDTATGLVNLNTVGLPLAGATTFAFQTAGPLTVNAPVQANTVDIAANGNIIVTSQVGIVGDTTKIAASGTGAITTTGAGTIDGGNLTLQSGSGGMGSKLSPLTINAGTLTIGSTGAVNVSDLFGGPTVLNTTTTVFGSFTLNTSSALTIDSITSAGAISVTAPGITLGNDLNPNPAVLNAAKGDITLNAGTQSLALAQAQVLSGNGNINLIGNSISTDQECTVTSNGGNTNITADTATAAGSVNLKGLVSANTGNLNISTAGTNPMVLTNNQGTLQAAGNLTITTNGGLFTTSNTNILANGNISINTGIGLMSINSQISSLVKGTITLNGVDISTNGAAQIMTNNGNIQVTDAVDGLGSTVKGLLSAVGGDVIFTSSGTGLTNFLSGTVQGTNVTIQQTGTGSLGFSSSNTVSNNGAVTVNAGTNTITLDNASIVSNGGTGKKTGISITAGTLTDTGAFNSITANNGNIGVNAATTGSGLDGAFLSTFGTVNMNFTGSATINGGGGNASIQGTAVNITSGGAALNINGGTVTSTNGNVVVQDTSTSAAISFASTVGISAAGVATSGGNITVALGAKLPTPTQLQPSTTPPSVNVNYAITAPGQILFAKGGITPTFNNTGGVNTLTADARNITLYIPSGSTGSITLQGAVNMTAAPVASHQLEDEDVVVDTEDDACVDGAVLSERI